MQKSKSSPRNKIKKIERFLALFAIITILAAWLIGGSNKGASFEYYLSSALPDATSFSQVSSDIYAGIAEDGVTIIGYVAYGEGSGYGGPMEVAVAVDLEGQIIGLAVIDSKDTPSYLERVFSKSFPSDLLGKSYSDPFELGNDIDGVTSATYTSAAVAESVRLASNLVAKEELGKIVKSTPSPKIVFGVPEITLLLLFVAGYLGRSRRIKNTKILRWGTMLTGMIVLGFLYNRPLTISKINSFLLGYWPEWQTNLYWYILIGGIIFVFTADNRNPYCEWFCPFGAAQECMGLIGGAKPRFTKEQYLVLTWVQRGLAWLAILLALLLRNPGVSSYEVFSTLFKLYGTAFSFVVLGLVLLTSLFIHRFWCRVLCPMRPVEGFIRLVRGWIRELWQQRKR